MDNRQRALNYLGLARRGGNIVYGEETVGAACRASHARLLVLAQDAADNTFRRARSSCIFSRMAVWSPGVSRNTAYSTTASGVSVSKLWR